MHQTDATIATTLELIEELLRNSPRRDFSVRLWDGTEWRPAHSSEPKFTLVLCSPAALRRFALGNNMLSLGKAYVEKEFDFEGDLPLAFELGDYLLSKQWTLGEKLKLVLKLWSLPQAPTARAQTHAIKPFSTGNLGLETKERSRQAIGYHYDLPIEFFRLWLDRNLVYSCAYFESESEDLETAQRRKLDYLCRKLRLEKGQRLLDLGCGWGALAVHAATAIGVSVLGITISEQQASFARRRVAALNLDKKCRIESLDYRQIQEVETFDRVVSVGMAEHVRESLLPDYFARVRRMIRPGGVFVHHAIARSISTPLRKGPSFMDRHIFPDTELVPISTTLKAAEDAGWEVRDVENLREHYALTLRHWLAALQQNQASIEQLTNEETYRKFQIYLAGCAHDFECGRLNIFQTILSRPSGGRSGLPLTRHDFMKARA